MKKRIAYIAPHETAKVLAVLYLLIGVLFALLALIIRTIQTRNIGGLQVGVGFFPQLLLPILYAVAGYIFTALFCWLYNVVAGWVGGIEINLTDVPSESTIDDSVNEKG